MKYTVHVDVEVDDQNLTHVAAVAQAMRGGEVTAAEFLDHLLVTAKEDRAVVASLGSLFFLAADEWSGVRVVRTVVEEAAAAGRTGGQS